MVTSNNLIRTILFISFALLLFGIACCGLPKSYRGISWNADFNLPLINKDYYILDLEDIFNVVAEEDELFMIYSDDMESDLVASAIMIRPHSSEVTEISSIETGTEILLSIDETGLEEDDIDLIYAEISEGIIKIEIIEPRPELIELHIVFRNLFGEDGLPFETVIDDFDTPIHSFDLAGYAVGDEDSEEIIDYLEFFVQTTSEEFYEDLVYLRIFFDEPIYFDFFRGYLTDKKVNLHDKVLVNDTNFPINISNALEFNDATLEFSLINNLGFDVQFIGTLIAVNDKDDKIFSLEIERSDQIIFQRAEEIGIPNTTSVILDRPEVAGLINTFPEQIRIENSSLIIGNTDETSGFAYALDQNTGSFTLRAPCNFNVNNATIIPDEIFSIPISENNRKYIDEYPEMLSLDIIMSNTLPIDATIDLYISELPDTLYLFNPADHPEVHTISFPSNAVSAAISENEPVIVENNFSLERQDIELFLNETVYYAMKINFEKSDGSVTILPGHYLNLLAKISVNLNLEI